MNTRGKISFCALTVSVLGTSGCVIPDATIKMADETGGAPPSTWDTSAGTHASTGGSLGVGGNNTSGGTRSTIGGAKPTGGAANTGGGAPTGGATNTGGVKSTGGQSATGGNKPTGGVAPFGGTSGVASSSSAGGQTGFGGTSGTHMAGTMTTLGGTQPLGGSRSAGGVATIGGTSNIAGSSPGGTTAAPSTCGFKQKCSNPLDYQCNDGTCIAPTERCDRISQCRYGEDENACYFFDSMSCHRCISDYCSSEYSACALASNNCISQMDALRQCVWSRQAGTWPGQSATEPYSASQVANCASLVLSQDIPLDSEAINLTACILGSANSCASSCLDSAAIDPQLANPEGWVGGDASSSSDDPMGFQSGWFAYTDKYSCPDYEPADGSAVNPCCGGRCCLHGTSFVDSTYAKWGCGMGFDFVSAGNAIDLSRAYTGPADGLFMTISGNLGGLKVRVDFTQMNQLGNKASPYIEISKPGEYAFDFLGATYPDWCTTSTCTGIWGDSVLAKPYGARIEIMGGEAASTFDFCVENVRPYSTTSWSCGADIYGTLDGCDCGCGARDPDCPVGGGCTQPSCSHSACDYCYNGLGNPIYCQ